MIFPEEETSEFMTNQRSPEYGSLRIYYRSIFFSLLLVNVARTMGILQDVLVCCVCVITFVPEIIWRVTFGQPL